MNITRKTRWKLLLLPLAGIYTVQIRFSTSFVMHADPVVQKQAAERHAENRKMNVLAAFKFLNQRFSLLEVRPNSVWASVVGKFFVPTLVTLVGGLLVLLTWFLFTGGL